MAQHAPGTQDGASKPSWLDRAADILKPQPGPPPRPATPEGHEGEWHKSVERKEVVPGLTVRDVGLSVFGETRSLRERPGSTEPIGVARQKVAHAIINDAELSHRTGKPRNAVHAPVKPSEKALRNPRSTLLTNLRFAPPAKPISAAMTQPTARRTLTCVRGLIVPTGNSRMAHLRASR